ncbi:cadherin-related family member 5 isoform X2 [Denticeps clupeoides]|uniref:Cadherin domain-containing protein n=1 Tax=Denticeps clupeoides TaxID=299321 RepID=A0AAY4C4F2_9TELE|nr:cadherin-related family member 5-like isoform X2 [Denticeps clupeoides]
MVKPWKFLLCQMAMNMFYHVVKASLCLGGHDIFAAVRENSPTGQFIANLNIKGDPGANSIRLCLTGENSNWFFLDGQTIRLNSSSTRPLDRESQGSVIMAALSCYEEDTVQSQYRIMVEILNENDNMPVFMEETIQPIYISELALVNTVVFTVKAKDLDGDTITYVIDQASPDASYFRIDLPNSGKVVLDKPLDYESKNQLEVDIYAVEMNTREKNNVTAMLTVNVLDGDDQYPFFLPCAPISKDQVHSICTNPVYTSNITEDEEDVILNFAPGPIHAEDGDKELQEPLFYTILSGDDHGRFIIDNQTGEIMLTMRVENRLLSPLYRLRIMAAQKNDPRKFTVATALVHVQAENRFPPHFNRTTYKGFVIENSSPATLVATYGNQVLLVQAIDQDFKDGVNPRLVYSLQPNTKLYHITPEGVLVAKTDHLQAFDRHIMEVVAMDQESGEITHATVDVEVLQKGQPVPRSQFGEERLFGEMDAKIAGGIAGVIVIIVLAALFVLVQLLRRRHDRQDPVDRGSVALGKHPNVSLRWFQMVNSGRPMPLIEDVSYHNEAFTDNESLDILHGKQGVYTKKEDLAVPPPPSETLRNKNICDMLPILIIPEPVPKDTALPFLSNGKGLEMSLSKRSSLNEGTSQRNKDVVLGTESITIKEEAQMLVDRRESKGDVLIAPSQGVRVTIKAEVMEKGQLDDGPDPEKRQSDDATANSSGGRRQSYKDSAADEDKDEEEIVNPYRSIFPVLYISDDEDSTEEDEPKSRPRYQRHQPKKPPRDKEQVGVASHRGDPKPHHSQQASSSKPKEGDQDQEHPQSGLLVFVEDSVEF